MPESGESVNVAATNTRFRSFFTGQVDEHGPACGGRVAHFPTCGGFWAWVRAAFTSAQSFCHFARSSVGSSPNGLASRTLDRSESVSQWAIVAAAILRSSALEEAACFFVGPGRHRARRAPYSAVEFDPS